MELRRALLLFAIVLGLAAIATSVSRPTERSDRAEKPPASEPVASPSPGPAAPLELTFAPAAKPPTERLEAGRPATVIVKVDEPGQVEIDGLGLTGAVEPLTPARFDVLTSDEGSLPVLFRPAGSREPRTVGTLEVGPAVAGR
jgi:hypothetical protein